MAIQKILGSDKLESGFRSKYNETVDEIWVNIQDNGDGTITVTKSNGTTFTRTLTSSFYTKQQVLDLLTGNNPATEDNAGIAELATLTETNTGEDDARIITPFKAKYSTLFAFKGRWISEFNYDPDEIELSGYSVDMVVHHNGIIYLSLIDFNLIEPGTDEAKWQAIGGGVEPEPITKTGADVDGNGDLDLSGSGLPEYAKLSVYVDGILNAYQIQYNNTTKIMSGFYGIDSGSEIKIVY
jgi:hypothetical protein